MRDLLSQYLLRATMDKEAVTDTVLQDENLLFHWATLTGQLTNELSQSLLREIVEVWMTIRGHAFAKQLIEQHKFDSGKATRKKKSMRQELSKGSGMDSDHI